MNWFYFWWRLPFGFARFFHRNFFLLPHQKNGKGDEGEDERHQGGDADGKIFHVKGGVEAV